MGSTCGGMKDYKINIFGGKTVGGHEGQQTNFSGSGGSPSSLTSRNPEHLNKKLRSALRAQCYHQFLKNIKLSAFNYCHKALEHAKIHKVGTHIS